MNRCPECGQFVPKKRNKKKKPGQKPGRKTDIHIANKIVKTFSNHPDWSLRKIAKEVGNISYVTVRRILQEHGLWLPSGRSKK